MMIMTKRARQIRTP
jgi:hypothetical protein